MKRQKYHNKTKRQPPLGSCAPDNAISSHYHREYLHYYRTDSNCKQRRHNSPRRSRKTCDLTHRGHSRRHRQRRHRASNDRRRAKALRAAHSLEKRIHPRRLVSQAHNSSHNPHSSIPNLTSTLRYSHLRSTAIPATHPTRPFSHDTFNATV